MTSFDPPDDSHLREDCLSTEVAHRGGFLQVKRDIVRLPDGNEAFREYIVHPGAVMIVPLLDDGSVVLERQYRYPHHRAFVEFPAGKIDPNEDPLVCATRELLEETGYRAREWHKLGVIHNAIAYSDEHIDIYLARGLQAGQRQLDAGEFLDVFNLPLDVLLNQVRQRQVTDVKTIIGAYWTEEWLRTRG